MTPAPAQRATGEVLVVRGHVVESRHEITAAVADAQGRLRWRVGDPDALVTYMRSSAKPLQALPAVEAGVLEAFGLDERCLALMCASHAGTPVHTQLAADILARAGLTPEHLQCGAHWPYHDATADAMRRRGERPTALCSNCSGKHAGMIAFAQKLGADVQTYRSPVHPVQRRIRRAVADMAGLDETAIQTAVDGCGVPVFAMSVGAMATAFARLAAPGALDAPRRDAVGRITAAMAAYPELVGGPGRFDSVLMASLRGRVISKVGAEGVQCMALPELGLGVALKVHDGAARAAGPAALEILSALGVMGEPERLALEPMRQPVLRNVAGDPVGEIRSEIFLRKVSARGT